MFDQFIAKNDASAGDSISLIHEAADTVMEVHDGTLQPDQ